MVRRGDLLGQAKIALSAYSTNKIQVIFATLFVINKLTA
jgi:hypothetical protein